MLDEELLPIALIGTSRAGEKALAPAAAGGKLAEAIAALSHLPAEARLLDAAAIVNNYRRCGHKPAAGTARPQACEPDEWPACSARAAELLEQILPAAVGSAGTAALVGEWLALAGKARRRVAHRLLPRLLDYAAAHRAAREAVAAVIDRRGQWLVRQNPRWQFGAAAEESAEAIWQTGSHEQRAAALARLRQEEPAKARELVRSTWQDDPAEDRAAFLEKLRAGLCGEDEEFLEAALDDRSKQVRAAAAELLARLPASKLVQRMIDRLTPLVRFVPGQAGSVLRMKKSRPGKLEVELPREFDKGMGRDGVVEKPPSGTGQKQWWLEQMLGVVPPGHWSEAWGVAPEECVRLAAGAEHGDLIQSAWERGCERVADGGWAEAMLRQQFEKSAARLSRPLLGALPGERFQELAEEFLSSARASLVTCSDLVNNDNEPLGIAAARALVRRVAEIVNAASRNELGVMWNLPVQAATRVPATMYDEIAAAWGSGEGNWQALKRQMDECLGILRMRREVWKELVT